MNFSFPFPPREFPDRGTKWLLGHPDHLRHLLRILAADISDRIDFDRLAPLPTELLSESLRKQLADLVFTAPFQDEAQGEVTIFILVEHQSTPSSVMRFRVLSYMVQLWDLQRQQAERERLPESQWRFLPILPVVFYTGSGTWEQPLPLEHLLQAPSLLARFVPRFDLLFLPVQGTPVEALRAEESAFGQLLRLMRQEEASTEAFQQELGQVIGRLEELTAEDRDEWSRLLYYLLLFIWHSRAPEEYAPLEHTIEAHHRDRLRHQEIETMGKTIVQHFIEEGEARGRKEGETQGRQLMLLNQLQAKFGDLPSPVEARIQQLSIAELDALAVRLIRAESLEELGL